MLARLVMALLILTALSIGAASAASLTVYSVPLPQVFPEATFAPPPDS